MPFCPNCGNEFQVSDNFCIACGTNLQTRLGVERELGANWEIGIHQELPYYISISRVLLMTVLSFGLYLFYWFYLTWKQYRDHTGDNAYPVWHALTLFVPIYGLFRTHAHACTFRDLMWDAVLSSSIRPGWSVLLVWVSAVLENISFHITGGFEFIQLTQETAILSAFLGIIAIALTAVLLLHLQSNINRYWHSLPDVRVTSARIGWGEVIFGIIGVLAWAGTLANIFSESWRLGL